MMKKLVILLAFLSLTLQSGCTSKDSHSESDITADFDSADLEKLEGDEALEIAADDSMASDQLPEDMLGETSTTTETVTTTTEPSFGDDFATTEQTDIATNSETIPADPFADTADIPTMVTESSTDIAESTPSYDDHTTMVESTTSSTTVTETTQTAKKVNVPLQKVATTPWKDGVWYNTIYFARPGDSLAGISQMIYGADRTSELKRGNPTYRNRDVRPGDKVYYNSPHRPEDASRIVTYYEDNGIAPEVYVAKPGDNIRTVSKNLLGYDNAWKEVWASNSVESKAGISEGTELHYWRGGAVAAAPAPTPTSESQYNEMAMNNPMETQPDYGQQAQADIPAPPPMDHAEMEMAPPPPPPMEMAQHDIPPPPPPIEAINPPAPPQHIADDSGEVGNDMTMTLGIVGIAAAGLAVLLVMRKKRRQRELDQQAMDHTHVGT